jgi:hypothetical protein
MRGVLIMTLPSGDYSMEQSMSDTITVIINADKFKANPEFVRDDWTFTDEGFVKHKPSGCTFGLTDEGDLWLAGTNGTAATTVKDVVLAAYNAKPFLEDWILEHAKDAPWREQSLQRVSRPHPTKPRCKHRPQASAAKPK